MPIKPENIIFAADYLDYDQLVLTLDQIHDYIGTVKVTPGMVISMGMKWIEQLARTFDTKLFLDMKFHDIPQTVYNAVSEAVKAKVAMLTVHIAGGEEMMRYAVQARGNGDTKIFGVTILTSSAASFDEVLSMAKKAHHAGLDGVICSAFEAKAIKQICGPSFIVVTPGIRLDGDSCHDQKRVATPQFAIDEGVDYIVVGRSITQAVDKLAAMKKILGINC